MEDFACPATNATNNTSPWVNRYHDVANAQGWSMLFKNLLLLLSSLITFFLVICKRKTRDPFAIILLTSYILGSASIVIETSILKLGFKRKEVLRASVSFANCCYLLAHWAFASKYL